MYFGKRHKSLGKHNISSKVVVQFKPSMGRTIYNFLKGPLETFRQLKLNAYACDYGNEVDPILGLSHELERLKYQNIIESIEVDIEFGRFVSVSGRADKWATSDDTLSRGGWPMLVYVSLGIEVLGGNAQAAGVSNLQETSFVALASSSTIRFDFKACK